MTRSSRPVHPRPGRRATGQVATTIECILRVIEESPGLNIQEIADGVGLSRSSVRHHVRRLVSAGRIAVHRQGRHQLHFAVSVPRMRRHAVAILRISSVRSIVDSVMASDEAGGRTGPARVTPVRVPLLAEETGVAVQTAYRCLRTLEDLDLVQMHRLRGDRGAWILSPHPDLRVAWALHFRDAPRAPQPLRVAPGWLLGMELVFGKLALGGWASS